MGLIGISNTIARLILGFLSQKLNRLFLYNTCLVICGLTMALSNYFQPMFAAVAGLDCQAEAVTLLLNTTLTDGEGVANMTQYSSWVCDPYYGQILYVLSYGVTR